MGEVKITTDYILFTATISVPWSFLRWKRGEPRKLFLMELRRVLHGMPPMEGLGGGVGLGVPAGLSLGVCTGVPLGVGDLLIFYCSAAGVLQPGLGGDNCEERMSVL